MRAQAVRRFEQLEQELLRLDDTGRLFFLKEHGTIQRNFYDGSGFIARNHNGELQFIAGRTIYNSYDIRSELPQAAELWTWQHIMGRTDTPDIDEIHGYVWTNEDITKAFNGDAELINDTLGLDITAAV